MNESVMPKLPARTRLGERMGERFRQLGKVKLMAGIIVASVLARVFAAIYLGPEVIALPGIADQLSYHELAQRVLNGFGFTFGEPWWPATRAGEPTAHWSYLYTLYLALIYLLSGVSPLVARVIQAVIVGILQPLMIFQLGAYIFKPSVGLLGAALTAVYAYFIYYAAALMTEAFFITMVLVSLTLAVKLVDSVNLSSDKLGVVFWTRLFLLGISIALSALLRQLFLLFLPFLLIWLWLKLIRHVGWRVTFASLTIVILIPVIFIALICRYNQDRFGSTVLLNTNAGFAFFWGNHPIHGNVFKPILSEEETSYGDLIPDELRGLNEAEIDRELMKRGLQFVFDDPRRYLSLSITRALAYFQFWPNRDSSFISNGMRLLSFGISWPFMLFGAVRAIQSRSDIAREKLDSVYLLLIFVVVYTGIHLLSWALIRYRLPVDAVMMIFMGYAGVIILEQSPRFQTVFLGLLRAGNK